MGRKFITYADVKLYVDPVKTDDVFEVADIPKKRFIVVLEIIILKFKGEAILIFNVILL